MSETISLLIGPFAAVVAGATFYILARRETNKVAAIVEQMKSDFHCQIEEQVRRLQEAPEVPIPEDVKKSAADFVRDAFNLLGKQSKKVAEELAEFNEHQQLAKERIASQDGAT